MTIEMVILSGDPALAQACAVARQVVHAAAGGVLETGAASSRDRTSRPPLGWMRASTISSAVTAASLSMLSIRILPIGAGL